MFRAIQACVLVCSLWMPLTAQENVWRNFSGVYKPPAKANGRFQTNIMGLDPVLEYEFRAIAVHPLITVISQPRDVVP